MKKKNELGIGWLNFLYGFFVFQCVIIFCTTGSAVISLIQYFRYYGEFTTTEKIECCLAFLGIVRFIEKIISCKRKYTPSGYYHIIATFIIGAISLVVNSCSQSPDIEIMLPIASIIAIIIYVPNIIYVCRRSSFFHIVREDDQIIDKKTLAQHAEIRTGTLDCSNDTQSINSCHDSITTSYTGEDSEETNHHHNDNLSTNQQSSIEVGDSSAESPSKMAFPINCCWQCSKCGRENISVGYLSISSKDKVEPMIENNQILESKSYASYWKEAVCSIIIRPKANVENLSKFIHLDNAECKFCKNKEVWHKKPSSVFYGLSIIIAFIAFIVLIAELLSNGGGFSIIGFIAAIICILIGRKISKECNRIRNESLPHIGINSPELKLFAGAHGRKLMSTQDVYQQFMKKGCTTGQFEMSNEEKCASGIFVKEEYPTSADDSAVNSNNNQVNFCRKCGAKLYPDSVFCQKCGEKVIK